MQPKSIPNAIIEFALREGVMNLQKWFIKTEKKQKKLSIKLSDFIFTIQDLQEEFKKFSEVRK